MVSEASLGDTAQAPQREARGWSQMLLCEGDGHFSEYVGNLVKPSWAERGAGARWHFYCFVMCAILFSQSKIHSYPGYLITSKGHTLNQGEETNIRAPNAVLWQGAGTERRWVCWGLR